MKFLYYLSKAVVRIIGFQNMGPQSTTLDFLNFCFKETHPNLSSISANFSQDTREQYNPQSDLTINMLYQLSPNKYSDDCMKIVDELREVSYRYTGINPFVNGSMKMPELMEELFPHVRYNYSSNKQYQECVALENQVLPQIEGYVVTFKEIEKMLMNWNSSEIQEALILVGKLSSYYGEIINIGVIYHTYQTKLEVCSSWLKPAVEDQYNSIFNSMPTLWDAYIFFEDISLSLTKIRNVYTKLYHLYTLIHPHIAILQSYINGNITKIELGERLKSMKESWDVLYQLKEDLQTQIREYSGQVTLAKYSLVDVFERILTPDFPIINSKNVYELELVERAAAINDSRIQEIVDNLKIDVIHYLPQLITQTSDGLIESMDQVTYGLIKPIEDELGQLDELRKDLENYQTSTRMDTDFFM